VKFRGRGDGVEASLETGDVGDDTVKGDLPDGRVLGSRVRDRVVPCDELEDLGETEVALNNLVVVGGLVRPEPGELLASGVGGGVLSEEGERLPRGNGGDVEVVAEDGVVGGRLRKGDFGEGRVEREDLEGGVALLKIGEAQDGEHAFDLDVRVRRPESDVVTSLVGDSRTRDVEFEMDAVPLSRRKELARDEDRGSVGVLGVGDALCTEEGSDGELALIDLVDGVGRDLGNDEIGRLAYAAFFKPELGGEVSPHVVLPGEVVLLHRLVVVSLADDIDSAGSKGSETGVELSSDDVIVLIAAVSKEIESRQQRLHHASQPYPYLLGRAKDDSRSVTQPKDDILEPRQVRAVAELRLLLLDHLHELDGVIRRLALSVRGHDEHDGAVLGHAVELVEVVLLDVAHERRNAVPGFGFFGKSSRVLLGCSGLRTVEDGEAFLLHEGKVLGRRRVEEIKRRSESQLSSPFSTNCSIGRDRWGASQWILDV
jgi:hypothetical protein